MAVTGTPSSCCLVGLRGVGELWAWAWLPSLAPACDTAWGYGGSAPLTSPLLVSCQVYVQHLLKKNKENIWKLVNDGNAHIYVCG